MKQQRSNRPKAATNSRYKITNWSAYNQALKQRGSLEIWVADEVEKQWYYTGVNHRGAQYRYSDSCIRMTCIIKQVYHLGYRQTQGFLESLMVRLGWKVQVPDYSVINRRHKNLHLEVKGVNKGKKKSGYHRRSIAEAAIFRLKTIFGEKLSSRELTQQQVEVKIRCYVLNKMAELGMPQTIKVKAAA